VQGKDLGLIRKYKKHTKHARKRPRTIDRCNRCERQSNIWNTFGREVDTKELTIRTDNGPQFKSKVTEV